jgi:hypothetical protein
MTTGQLTLDYEQQITHIAHMIWDLEGEQTDHESVLLGVQYGMALALRYPSKCMQLHKFYMDYAGLTKEHEAATLDSLFNISETYAVLVSGEDGD